MPDRQQFFRELARHCGDAYRQEAIDCFFSWLDVDNPELAAPTVQVNPADKLSFFDNLMSLPMRQPGESPKADEFKLDIVSRQHPDHDTEHWPPTEGFSA